MKILLNTTTLNVGGALQASVAFIREVLSAADGVEWCFALSRQVESELTKVAVDLRRTRTELFEKTPAKHGEARRRLRELEADFAPDVVFTFFGPAYVSFEAPHLCGVADGWVTHSGVLAFQGLGLSRQLIEMPLRILHKAYWFRHADAWVVEAEVAKLGLIHRLRLPAGQIAVVPNNCGQGYFAGGAARFPECGEKVRILCFSACLPSKNLGIIPYVAKEIVGRSPALDFEFVITLPTEHAGLKRILRSTERLGVTRHIRNIGPVAIADGPALYESCHISFLPSLLETFSATYPESMAMARPIVTTDLHFAREICGDAAVYFEPKNPAAAAEAILKLLDDRELWERQVGRGKQAVRRFPDPRQKYERYRDILCEVAGDTCR